MVRLTNSQARSTCSRVAKGPRRRAEWRRLKAEVDTLFTEVQDASVSSWGSRIGQDGNVASNVDEAHRLSWVLQTAQRPGCTPCVRGPMWEGREPARGEMTHVVDQEFRDSRALPFLACRCITSDAEAAARCCSCMVWAQGGDPGPRSWRSWRSAVR